MRQKWLPVAPSLNAAEKGLAGRVWPDARPAPSAWPGGAALQRSREGSSQEKEGWCSSGSRDRRSGRNPTGLLPRWDSDPPTSLHLPGCHANRRGSDDTVPFTPMKPVARQRAVVIIMPALIVHLLCARPWAVLCVNFHLTSQQLYYFHPFRG